MIRVNQQSGSKVNAGKESCKPKTVKNDSDSYESMFVYGSDQFELPEWCDTHDSSTMMKICSWLKVLLLLSAM